MATKETINQGAETILQNLFTYFSYFGFDKAKEQADRERDASKNHCSPVWITLLTCISQLAAVEKLYMNLAFLTPKGFLRKESPVRLTYETILTELAEIEKRRALQCNTPNSSCSIQGSHTGALDKNNRSMYSEGVLLHISAHLIFFIQARLLMLSFYEKLISCAAGKYINYEDMLTYITEIIQKNSNSFHHPILAPIKTTFNFECDIMSHLLGSLKAMQEWQFLPSLLHLHDAHTKLLSWQAMVQNRESKKYSFSSTFLKSSSYPILYQWLGNAKACLVSKFSLYFYETLSRQAPPTEMRNILSKQSCDYVTKIQNFQRKTDALSICLILDTTGLEELKGQGYHHPSESVPLPSGLDSYPAIFSYPTKPLDHWPSIVMRVSDRNVDHASADKAITFFDLQVGATFVSCRVEPRITLVAIFESKKPEKENNLVKDFINDLVVQLRCNKVFASLKPN